MHVVAEQKDRSRVSDLSNLTIRLGVRVRNMRRLSDTNLAPARDKFPRNEKVPDRRGGLAPGSGCVFRTPGDDGLQGQIVLVRGLAEVGVEAVVTDGQRVIAVSYTHLTLPTILRV